MVVKVQLTPVMAKRLDNLFKRIRNSEYFHFHPRTYEKIPQVLELYEQGYGYSVIAKKLEMGLMTVRRVIKEFKNPKRKI